MFRAGKAVKQVLSVRSVASSAKQARVQPTQSSSSMTWGVVAAGVVLGGVTATALFDKKEERSTIFPTIDAALFGGAAVPLVGVPGTKNERTFIAIKPDGVQRGLIGEVIARFERKGYKLVGIKVLVPTKEFAEKHYADLSKKPFFPSLVEYFSSGPVVAMVWEGTGVIVGGRQLVGATNPKDAAPGSIRGDFAVAIGRNIIHGSDSPQSAADELALWFTDKEVANFARDSDKWIYESK